MAKLTGHNVPVGGTISKWGRTYRVCAAERKTQCETCDVPCGIKCTMVACSPRDRDDHATVNFKVV